MYRSFVKYAIMGALVASILLLVSGRTEWLRAWLFVGSIIAAQVVVGVLLHRRCPDLLVERSKMQPGTKSWDKLLAPIIAIGGPVAIWLVAALDVRSHWPPPVPPVWSAAAFAVCLGGIVLTGWAMLTNRFFAATVRIQKDRGHKVIDSGPYAFVRHPGYTGAMAFTLASPIAVGSWIAVVPAAITGVILGVRTALEDRTLANELPGYLEYKKRVGARLFPGIW